MNENGLCHVVASVLGVDEDSVSYETSMENCEKWDSLRHFNLILAIEQAHGVRFSSARISELISVRALSEELAKLKA